MSEQDPHLAHQVYPLRKEHKSKQVVSKEHWPALQQQQQPGIHHHLQQLEREQELQEPQEQQASRPKQKEPHLEHRPYPLRKEQAPLPKEGNAEGEMEECEK